MYIVGTNANHGVYIYIVSITANANHGMYIVGTNPNHGMYIVGITASANHGMYIVGIIANSNRGVYLAGITASANHESEMVSNSWFLFLYFRNKHRLQNFLGDHFDIYCYLKSSDKVMCT